MKISHNWLQDYLPFQLEPGRIAEILTDIGLEVEELYEWQSVPGGLRGLVIGEVKEVVKHPNADKLVLTKVSIGNGDPLSIVCGAPNVESGQRVVVAPVNVTLHPVTGEPFKIKKAKIRGQESHGMICAEDEIGLGENHDGIIVLAEDAPIGKSVADYMQVASDWVFDIALTPNRADAMSHIGVARDLCAYMSFHHNEKGSLQLPTDNLFAEGDEASIPVEIEDPQACSRYSGLTISEVTVAPSATWMQNRLKAVDVRPINNIVDITNYVLHELGQPLHAFDVEEIRGGKVIVKTLADKTAFTTLDEAERKLSDEDLMICDAEGGMCIAGVFGGLGSGVTEKTHRVFLESAHFDPVSVRRTSFRHDLRTDAAMRFEKGTDPGITVRALKRAAHLLKELSDRHRFSKIIDVYPQPIQPKQVKADFHFMDRLMGAKISDRAAEPILSALGMGVSKNGESITVDVPTYKSDIEHPADLVEEVLRIYGMDRIDVSPQFVTAISHESDERYKLRDVAGNWLADQGFHEMMSLSMTGDGQGDVPVLNPLSSELSLMRSSMLHSGLETIARNHNHRQLDLKLFEFGNVYKRLKEDHGETEQLSIFITGHNIPETWERNQLPVGFYSIKIITTRLLDRLGVEWASAEGDHGSLTNTLALTHGETLLGTAGQVNGSLLKQFDIDQPVFYSELNWQNCQNASTASTVRFKPVSRFPTIRRDLAIILNEEVQYAAVEQTARAQAGAHLAEINLFDVYRDEKIGRGKKSYAMAFTFNDATRTLTDEEADEAIARIMKAIEKEFSASIRTE